MNFLDIRKCLGCRTVSLKIDFTFLSHFFVKFGARVGDDVFLAFFVLLREYTAHDCITGVSVQYELWSTWFEIC